MPREYVPNAAFRLRGVAIVALALGLAACNTAANLGGGAPASPAITVSAPAVPVNPAELPGSWGLASYHQEKDRARTEQEARNACGNPYRIGQGPNGGIMMHLADQTQPSEVFVKTSSDGRTFIGPRGAPGVLQDRVVTYFQNGVLVTEWLDRNVRERYGTMVLVRCA